MPGMMPRVSKTEGIELQGGRRSASRTRASERNEEEDAQDAEPDLRLCEEDGRADPAETASRRVCRGQLGEGALWARRGGSAPAVVDSTLARSVAKHAIDRLVLAERRRRALYNLDVLGRLCGKVTCRRVGAVVCELSTRRRCCLRLLREAHGGGGRVWRGSWRARCGCRCSAAGAGSSERRWGRSEVKNFGSSDPALAARRRPAPPKKCTRQAAEPSGARASPRQRPLGRFWRELVDAGSKGEARPSSWLVDRSSPARRRGDAHWLARNSQTHRSLAHTRDCSSSCYNNTHRENTQKGRRNARPRRLTSRRRCPRPTW